MFNFAVKRGFSLFSLSISVFCFVQSQAARLPVNGSLGQSVYLSLENPHGLKIDEVFWKRSSPKPRIARYMKNHVQYFGAEDYKKRIKLHPGNFSLQINDLQRADTGDYEVIVTGNSEVENTERVKLDVYEPVTGTKISYQITENCNITLSCSVNTGDNTSFSWWMGQETLRNDSIHHLSENGQELQLHFAAQIEDNVYKCEARNPVSEGTAHIKLRDVCNVTKPETDSSGSFPYEITGYVAVPIIIILLIFCYCSWKNKAALRKNCCIHEGSNKSGSVQDPTGPESQTIYACVQAGKSHGEQRPSPEGNEMVPKQSECLEMPLTVYDTIRNPGVPEPELLDK
ncbi:SLAM family member 8-like [Mustelus asterias]